MSCTTESNNQVPVLNDDEIGVKYYEEEDVITAASVYNPYAVFRSPSLHSCYCDPEMPNKNPVVPGKRIFRRASFYVNCKCEDKQCDHDQLLQLHAWFTDLNNDSVQKQIECGTMSKDE